MEKMEALGLSVTSADARVLTHVPSLALETCQVVNTLKYDRKWGGGGLLFACGDSGITLTAFQSPFTFPVFRGNALHGIAAALVSRLD